MLVTICSHFRCQVTLREDILELSNRLCLDNGIKFSINSDDPAYFGSYILDDHCAMQDAFSLAEDDWARKPVPPGRKSEMLNML